MPYKYSFDDRTVGNLRLRKDKYKLLHECYQTLFSQIESWNKKALQEGANRAPFGQEAEDLTTMIEWGNRKLSDSKSHLRDIIVNGISIGSLRYAKAALLFGIKKKEDELSNKVSSGWPETVIQSIDESIDHLRQIEESINYPPSDLLFEIFPQSEGRSSKSKVSSLDRSVRYTSKEYDELAPRLANIIEADKNLENLRIFLSYAREDGLVAEEIYKKLVNAGFCPWMDVKDLIPGEKWDHATQKAIRNAALILVFLSKISVSKRGYIQKEFKFALDTLDELPEGQILVIPIRLEACEVPDRFKHLQYCDLFEEGGFDKLLSAIRAIATRVIAIPVTKKDEDLYFVEMTGEMLKQNTELYLVVIMHKETQIIKSDKLHQMIRIASPDSLEKIISRSYSPSLDLQFLAYPPPSLTERPTGFYFRLEKFGRIWESICRSQTMSIYLPHEEFPEIKSLELTLVS